MKETPMIFGGDMVNAIKNVEPQTWPAEILNDCCYKIMTRRVITRIPGHGKITDFRESETPGYKWCFRDKSLRWHEGKEIKSPYEAGDIIWVREKFQIYPAMAFFGKGPIKPYEKIPKEKPESFYMEFAADNEKPSCGTWRSSLFLPRWAARITLKIRSVKIQRLKSIPDMDTFYEGIDTEGYDYNLAEHYQIGGSPIQGGSPEKFAFIALWERKNAKRGYSWDENPHVWVIEFMRLS
jgi:hypothetical protein